MCLSQSFQRFNNCFLLKYAPIFYDYYDDAVHSDLYCLRTIVFDRHLRRFHNRPNLAAALDGQTPGKLPHLIIRALIITEN